MTFRIGDRVRDTYSKFEGWVHGVSEFITGCNQVLVNPRAMDDKGQPRDGVWFDDVRLEVIERYAATTPSATAKPGGPTPSESAGRRNA